MKQFILMVFTLALIYVSNSTLLARGAHEHGVASLQMAIEDNKITLILESPSESFYGFEHEAKNESDKNAQNSALDILKNHLSDLIVFDSALQCKLSNLKLDVVKEEEGDDDDHDHDSREKHQGEHREIRGEWVVSCKKSPMGSTLQFQFSKKFPRLSKIKFDLISDKKQTHEDLRKGDGKVKL